MPSLTPWLPSTFTLAAVPTLTLMLGIILMILT